MTYYFSDELISDFHKDAYGCRPDQSYMEWWGNLTDDEKETEWTALENTMNETIDREEEEAALAAQAFREGVEKAMEHGGDDWTTTLGWFVTEEQMEHQQAVEAWVYGQGFLFTDFGKQIVKEVCALKGIYYHKGY